MSLIMTLLSRSGLYVATVAPPAKGAAPAEVEITAMKVISLRDLTAPQEPVVSGPKGFQASMMDVFAAAKLPAPEGGWTAERMLDLARKPLYREMSPENRQKAVLAELATHSVNPETVVLDAVRKDQALDAYERFLQKKLEETRREAESRRAALQKEIAAVEGMLGKTEGEFAAWQAAKRGKEAELAEALEPLLAHGKISRS